jgi:hypothetical protein
MMRKQTLTVGAIALILGLTGGYFGERAFASNAPRGSGNFTRNGAGVGFTRGMGMMGGPNGAPFGGAGGGLVAGTVAAKDAQSITVDTRDGSSKVVLISPATTVAKSALGTLDDVMVGSTVIIMGSTSNDGSISASSIQLRPDGAPGTMAQ